MTLPRRIPRERVKERYNPTPTAREKAYHLWLMEVFPCICGCGGASTVVHHPLTRHPAQRWRRDHEYVVPMAAECHMYLHATGDERLWRPDLPLGWLAHRLRNDAIELCKL